MPNDTESDKRSLFPLALFILVAAALFAAQLVVSPGTIDVFRTPKDVAFQVIALATFGVLTAGALFVRPAEADKIALPRLPLIAAASAILWTTVAVMASEKPVVGMFKPLTVFCLGVLFVAALPAVRGRGMWAVAAVLVPAAINALVAALQGVGVVPKWDWVLDHEVTAWLGNPNELAGALVLPAVAAVACALVWPRRKWMFGVAAVLVAGILAAHALTSMLAFGAGVTMLLFNPAARRLRLVAGATLLLFTAALFAYPVSRERLVKALSLAAEGEWIEAATQRPPGWAVAAVMFTEHPLLGAGPGMYAAEYMTKRIEIDERFPQWIQMTKTSFSEAHNDHLQLLAETGLIGYVLFLFSLVLVARVSFRPGGAKTPQQQFARAFALPSAVSFFVLAAGHFPMQLTSTMVPAVYLSALCFAWSSDDTHSA